MFFNKVRSFETKIMFTIFGFPDGITHNYLQNIIQMECNISEFLLDHFLQDADGKICVSNEAEAYLVKGHNNFNMSEHVLSAVAVPLNNASISQNNVDTTSTDANCTERSDSCETSSVDEVLKVQQELSPKRVILQPKLKVKQAALMNSQCENQSLEKLSNQSPVEEQQMVAARFEGLSLKKTTPAPSISTPVIETRKRPGDIAIAFQQSLKGSEHDQKRVKLEDPAPVSIVVESFTCVAITCALTGYLTQESANLLLDVIHMQLIHDSTLPSISNVPVFRKRPKYRDGAIKLFCDDQNTLEWLQSVVLNVNLAGGIQLMMNEIDITDKTLCGVVIPNERVIQSNPRDILRLLSYQNRWVDVDRWQFIGSVPRPGIYFMKVLIPNGHIKTLVQAERRLAYSLGSVYLKILGRPTN